MHRTLAFVAAVLLLAGCTWKYANACGYNRNNPSTEVKTLNGQVLHPDTGLVVDCNVLGPWEGQVTDVLAGVRMHPDYARAATLEIAGYRAVFAGGMSRGQVYQGIAISRACRGVK